MTTENEPSLKEDFIPSIPHEVALEVIGKHGGDLSSWLVEQVIALRKRVNILEEHDL